MILHKLKIGLHKLEPLCGFVRAPDGVFQLTPEIERVNCHKCLNIVRVRNGDRPLTRDVYELAERLWAASK